MIVAVRGFQAAWPPLAYSVADDAEAGRLYAFVTTAYVAGHRARRRGDHAARPLARAPARRRPSYFAAHEALPWVALGWALYGLNLVFVTIAGRAKVTTRNFPAAVAGLVGQRADRSSRSSTRWASPAPASPSAAPTS